MRGDSVSGRPSATVVGGGGGVYGEERRREGNLTLPPLFLQETPPPLTPFLPHLTPSSSQLRLCLTKQSTGSE